MKILVWGMYGLTYTGEAAVDNNQHPHWAKYLAKDGDGTWLYHEMQPIWLEKLDAWISCGIVRIAVHHECFVPADKSLVELEASQ